MNVPPRENTNDSDTLEVMMNQIDETWEQHMKFDLIYSVCATNHIIVSPVMGSGGLVKLKQPSPPTSHTHMHVAVPLPLSALPCAPRAIKPQRLFSIR